MQLINMRIENFKGISQLEIDVAGQDLSIYGRNATGKSTVEDAFSWLLFDKDAGDRKNFEIKPLDASGKIKDHQAVTVVSAVVEHVGEHVTFRKEYREKWVKKHGSTAPEFTGNETRYFVDDLEVKAKGYDEAVGELCSGDKSVLRLLTHPLYFNAIDWKDRRRILFEMCDAMDDGEVIRENPALAPLSDYIGRHSVDDFKRICADRRKALIKQLDDTATRLAELKRQAPVPIDVRAVQAKVSEIQAQLEDGDTGRGKEKDLLQKARARRQTLEYDRDALQAQIDRGNAELARLRADWQRISVEEWSGGDTCPTCNRPLSPDTVAQTVEAFQQEKERSLCKNGEAGKALAAELAGHRERFSELTTSIGKADAFILELESKLEQPPETDTEALREQLAAHQANIIRAQEQAKTTARIDELEALHKTAAADLETAEQQIGLCEAFTRKKIAAIECHVNGMFQYARFNLFREQVNGELAEICETTFEGVPFPDLNTAAKINIGLDIINTLSKRYDISAPVFIDNAESITELLPVDAQLIRLVVSDDDNTLRIEPEMEDAKCLQTV